MTWAHTPRPHHPSYTVTWGAWPSIPWFLLLRPVDSEVSSTPSSASLLQVSFLEKKVTELENDSLTNGDLKSKLKQENTQLVHRLGLGAGLGGPSCGLGTAGDLC